MDKGDFIKIDFVGRIKGTNELFDTTDEELAKKENSHNPQAKYGPISIVVGEGQILQGLEDEILSMKVGDKKTIEINAEKGFGPRSPKMIKTVSESQLKSQNVTPVPGMILNISNAMGRVMSVSSGRVKIDFNHPLAGKDLIYDLQIKEKVDGDEDKIGCIVERYMGKDVKVSIKGEEATINADVPKEYKEQLSNEVMKYVSSIKRVKFEEVFESKPETAKKDASGK